MPKWIRKFNKQVACKLKDDWKTRKISKKNQGGITQKDGREKKRKRIEIVVKSSDGGHLKLDLET